MKLDLLKNEQRERITTTANQSNVAHLLAVPRYADILEDDADMDTSEDEDLQNPKARSGLIKSRSGWRKGMAKWIQEEQELDEDEEELENCIYGRQRSKFLPRSLELLFAARKETDIDEQLRRTRRCQAYTEEARLMELLADEEMNEERIPDDERCCVAV